MKWTKWALICVAVVVVASLAIWLIASRGSGAEAAQWRLDPSFTPTPESTNIPLLVQEADCSSGTPVTGRTELSVRYSDAAVTIDIRVWPLEGDQTCQANETPFSVQLREPLGQRALVDANARTP